MRLSRRAPSFIGSTCRVKECWRATVASALDRGNVICPAHRSSKTLLGVFYAPASVPSTSWLTRSRVPRPRVAEASSASVARTGSMALPALVPSRMRAVDAPRLQRRQPDRGNGQPSAGHARGRLNAVRASVSCGEIAARSHSFLTGGLRLFQSILTVGGNARAPSLGVAPTSSQRSKTHSFGVT